MAVLLAGCGGATTGGPGSSGSGGSSDVEDGGSGSGGHGGGSGGAYMATGGAGASTGGAGPALLDCENPVAAGTLCSMPSVQCGGPCSNSWQIENVCQSGKWESTRVVPCGPNASNPPQCKNSFSGGELTPCCPEGNLTCVGKPDGYPGFGCTPGDGSFCSCTCFGGMPSCGC